jgi:hypothetical protein
MIKESSMNLSRKNLSYLLSAIIFFMMAAPPETLAAVRGAFLYTLASFTGTIPYNWARVSIDHERDEIYVLYQNYVRVFNESGMEIYRFGEDIDLGHVVDLAVLPDGDILMLSYAKGRPTIIWADFRGKPKSEMWFSNLPPEFTRFSPSRMIYSKENLYFASLNEMRVVMTDSSSRFKEGYDIPSLIGLTKEEKKRTGASIVGFNVDEEGNILFTVPVLFKVYRITPDCKVSYFGEPGGAPGRFNVLAGVMSDSRGNLLIVDKLKGAVMVFDKNFRFTTQFSKRGRKPGDLIAPDELAIDSHDRVYVTQSMRRGVSVFQLLYD